MTARRAGAFALNLFRITLALVFLTLFLFLSRTVFTPERLFHPAPGAGFWPAFPRSGVAWLALSGVLGLTIGDLGYFGALKRLGPRLATVLQALAPPITAVIAWLVLREGLSLQAVAGMVLVLAGVVLAVLERSGAAIPKGHLVQGIWLGLLAAACQAVGLILSKKGMQFGIDPLPANVVRMGAATAGVWTLALVSRQPDGVKRIVSDRTALFCALGATLLGPVIGVWLSLVAAKHTQTGIAATLMATVPVLVLPLVIFFNKEKVSPRAVFGAALTVAGVALIFVR